MKEQSKKQKNLIGFISEGFILKVLEAKQSHGWGILEALKEASDGEVEWMPGSIYAVINRLEESGCIEGIPDQKKIHRKIYQITPIGRVQLVKERIQWEMFNEIINYKL